MDVLYNQWEDAVTHVAIQRESHVGVAQERLKMYYVTLLSSYITESLLLEKTKDKTLMVVRKNMTLLRRNSLFLIFNGNMQKQHS